MRRLAILLALAALQAPAAAQAPATPAATWPAAGVQVRPPWTEAAARATLAEVQASAAEGLWPADYGETRLAQAIAGRDPVALAAAAEASWLALARDYAAGRTPGSARLGWKSPPPRWDSGYLQGRLDRALQAGEVREELRALLPTHPFYQALKAALPAAATPEARAQLRANMDRWRWMPRNLGDHYLLANVPAFELQEWRGGTLIATHRIIVGATRTPTPQFSAVAIGVILNPPWQVPQSIIAESVGGLIRRSPSTARARGYSWTQSGGRLSVTQAPGPGNSLGVMKIDMPNPWAIFLHDTPAKSLFDRPIRALSHGCMRTEGIVDLGARLLVGMPGWDRALIDSTLATRKTLKVPLPSQVPVHVTYLTVAPGADGAIRTHRDIYGRDAPVISALSGRDVADAGAEQALLAEGGCYAAMPNRPA